MANNKTMYRKRVKANIKRQTQHKATLHKLLAVSTDPDSAKEVSELLDTFQNKTDFKKAVELLDNKVSEQATFKSEYKKIFGTDKEYKRKDTNKEVVNRGPYKKFLSWNTFTVYTRTPLIIGIFAKWYGNTAKHESVAKTVKVKRLVGTETSKTGKVKNVFQKKEVTRVVKLPTIQKQINWMKRSKRLMDRTDQGRDLYGKMGVLKTYAFKLINLLVEIDTSGEKHYHRRPSSFTESSAVKSRIQSLVNRRERLKNNNKTNIDMDWLQQQMQEKKDYYPFSTAATPEDTQKQMTLLSEVFRSSKVLKEVYDHAIGGSQVHQRELVGLVIKRFEKKLVTNGY